MSLYGPVRDGQAEAASSLPPRIEGIENAGQIVRIDSRTIIDHADADRVAERHLRRHEIRPEGVGDHLDAHGRVGLTDLDGVQHEVEQRAMKKLRIAPQP